MYVCVYACACIYASLHYDMSYHILLEAGEVAEVGQRRDLPAELLANYMMSSPYFYKAIVSDVNCENCAVIIYK